MHVINEDVFYEGKRIEVAYMLAQLLCKLGIAKLRRQSDPNTMLQMSSLPKNFRNAYMLPIASMTTSKEYAVLVSIDEEKDKMDIDLW